jgi:hypothetical protein
MRQELPLSETKLLNEFVPLASGNLMHFAPFHFGGKVKSTHLDKNKGQPIICK